MIHFFKIKKSILAFILSVVFILGSYFIFHFKNPSCADAQCVSIIPETKPWLTIATAFPNGQGCTTQSVSVGFSFPLTNSPRNFAVALTGWTLQVTGGPNGDIHWSKGRVRILENTITASGSSANFMIDVCLGEDGSGAYPRQYQIYGTAMAWQ